MRKKIFTAIAITAFIMSAAAGTAMADTADAGQEIRIINELPPANPGPGEFIGRFPEEAGESGNEGELFTDDSPLKKWGYIASADANTGRIIFNSNETYTDENGTVHDSVMETVLNVADGVPVTDAVSGMPVSYDDIDKSAPAYVWTSRIMTLSLPPQTAAQAIVVNVPEGYTAPSYVVVKELVTTDTDGQTAVTITDQDGNKWSASAEKTEVTPYLTRNIVTIDDIAVGSRCMIWGSPVSASDSGLQEYEAQKIMLFAR